MTDENPSRVHWAVVNRETGIVVSLWPEQTMAHEDKSQRDIWWEAVEPQHESKLVVERRDD